MSDKEKSQIKRYVLVGAGKGGVGKSTVAVNLAMGLREQGAKVGLLDADAHGPSIPMMMGVGGERPSGETGRIEPVMAHGVPCMSIGFLVDPDQAMIWRGPMLAGALMQLLTDVSWGELDYLVIDLPPGTGDVPLTLAQKVKGASAVLVTTPQDVALADVRRVRAMLEKVEIPVLGLVENMSYLVCSGCGEEMDVFHRGGGEKAAREMGLTFLGAIPLHPKIREGGDGGVPHLVADPKGPEGRAFMDVARRVAEEVEKKEPDGPPSPGGPHLRVIH